jgi:hypothetical protein
MPGRLVIVLFCIALCVTECSPAAPAVLGISAKTRRGANAYARVSESRSLPPLSFEANAGQLDRHMNFMARGDGYSLLLTTGEMMLSVTGTSARTRVELNNHEPIKRRGTPLEPGTVSHPAQVVRIRMVGANQHSKATGLGKYLKTANYFNGNNVKNWKTNIPTYAQIKYSDIYPGIDLIYYGNQQKLEHDFIIRPGTDVSTIRLYTDSKEMRLDAAGDLLLGKNNALRFHKPLIYQERDGVRIKIAGRYLVHGSHEFGFEVEKYDTTLPLVIDPIISYSTFLGGQSYDEPSAICTDPEGNIYVVGSTSSTNFPTMNPYMKYAAGDAFVTKINAYGEIVYSTYLGGNNPDYGKGIAADSDGNAYVTGYTWSGNFPTVNPVQGKNGWVKDAFILKLSPSGDRLIYSTFLGGSENEEAYGITVDSNRNAFVTGTTWSSRDFPTVNAVQPRFGGVSDIFVAKLNPMGNALLFSTYLGGTSGDHGYAITSDAYGNAYVTGQTDILVFVAKLSASGDDLIYSKILGLGQGYGIAVDTSGSSYITGGGGMLDAFVFKLTPAGDGIVYSTSLGGSTNQTGYSTNDVGNSIAVDAVGNAYVTGYTQCTDFPTANPIQDGFAGGITDAFVAELNPSGSALLFSTYLGGNGEDRGQGIAVDSLGNIYVTGYTTSVDFPNINAIQDNLDRDTDMFVTKISHFYPVLKHDLKAGGASRTTTSGKGNSLRVGYASAALNSGATPYATAVFSFKQNGITVAEAGVPASPPTTQARIFVEYRINATAIPGRSDAGIIDINTGIAVVNYGSSTANVTYTLRDLNGIISALGHGTIAAGGHFAKFIDQFKEVAPDFSLPLDFTTKPYWGSLDIASDQPLSVLALRGTSNQRDEFLVTTTPMADLTQPLGYGSLYFPQFADGGGYTTSLLLLNTSNQSESGVIHILDNQGAPLVVNQVGGTADSSFRYLIPSGGVFRLQSDGFPASTRAGWVRLAPDNGSPTPVGSGVFSYNPGSIMVSESGISSAISTTRARIYVDLSRNHNTGLAVANLSGAAANITIKAFQTDGSTPAGSSQGLFQLGGNGHDAKFADQIITGLPEGFRGVLDISSATSFAALTVHTLINERHDFLMTTFPTADANQAAPAPIVFPQIADGGGYVTQFIFLSPREASSSLLKFYNEDGAPLGADN